MLFFQTLYSSKQLNNKINPLNYYSALILTIFNIDNNKCLSSSKSAY